MRKLHYEITSVTDEKLISLYEEIMAAAMNQVEKIVCKYRYILPRGWRCITKIDDPRRVGVHLDLQANPGGGSFAEVKMKTLEDFNKAATGTDNIDFIHELIGMAGQQNSELGQEILNMSSTAELRRAHHEWLKNELGYTDFYGAFCVPYDMLSARVGSSEKYQHGSIKIAFSGASEEQDVMFAMWTFRRIQNAMVETFKRDQFWFNLRELEEIPKVRFWIDNLDVRETA